MADVSDSAEKLKAHINDWFLGAVSAKQQHIVWNVLQADV